MRKHVLERDNNLCYFNQQYSDVNYILRDLNGKLDAKIAPAPVNFFGKKKVSDEKQYKPNDTMLSRMPATEFMNQV